MRVRDQTQKRQWIKTKSRLGGGKTTPCQNWPAC